MDIVDFNALNTAVFVMTVNNLRNYFLEQDDIFGHQSEYCSLKVCDNPFI
ncbi:hypothetical protein [Psychrobacter sp. H7-1]|nr:hypothetical protein [Psychrobacter sp. H7-1]